MAIDTDVLTVMTTIDETRDHMSEGRYLRTCDALKRVHDKLKRPKIPLPRPHILSAILKFGTYVTAIKIFKRCIKD